MSVATLCRVIESGWLVRYVPAEVAQPAVPVPSAGELLGGWSEWLAEEDITSFLAQHTQDRP